jgi:hypothetical protein|tara:strand:- start:167 stop:718 length:552 start_codon:yes stop_codon:yes gene_type:complete
MAFKMNYNRDSFPFKNDERVKDDLINIRKNERPTEQGKGPTKMNENKGYPKYGHDKGLTKTMENKGYPLKGDLNKDNVLSGYEANRQSKIDESMNKSKDGPTKNKYSHNTMKTPYAKHGGTKPQSQMTEDELAKHKGIKKPQSQRIPQGDFEPMFMGGDISKEEFDKMSKEEQKEYMEKYAAD